VSRLYSSIRRQLGGFRHVGKLGASAALPIGALCVFLDILFRKRGNRGTRLSSISVCSNFDLIVLTLGADEIRGIPESIAWGGAAAANRRAVKAPAPVAVPQNTLKFIIAKFRTSTDYTQLSASSKRAYATYLKPIELEFGDMPLAALSDPRVRGDFLEWRDEMSNTPRKADYAWTGLARLLSFGKNRGIIAVNPCERGGRLYRADRADMIWGDDQLARLFTVASPEVAAVVMFALWTGQRQGDILRLPWSGPNCG
jgi:hypothetical protein